MSLKNRLLTYLKSLERSLGSDEESAEALDFLKNKVSSLKEEPKQLPLFEEIPDLKSKTAFALFSDGACRGNPGPGSWACMGQDYKGQTIFSEADFENPTTNNKMELMAATKALELLQAYLYEKDIEASKIILFTDSKYVIDGITSWVTNWKARGWKKADKKSPENLEYWQRLDEIHQELKPEYRWVKGHSGHPQNEHCDALANEILDNEGF